MFGEYTDLAGQQLLSDFTFKTDRKDRENGDDADVDMSSVDEEDLHNAFDALVHEELNLLQPFREDEEMLHNEHADTDMVRMEINPETDELEATRIGPTDPYKAAEAIKQIKKDRNEILKT